MWAHARYDLRLSSEEFWDLTPCEVYALMDRHQDAVELQHVLIVELGQFMSMFVNLNPNIPAEHRKTKPADFIPQMGRVVEPAKPAEKQKPDGSYRMSLWKAYAQVVK